MLPVLVFHHTLFLWGASLHVQDLLLLRLHHLQVINFYVGLCSEQYSVAGRRMHAMDTLSFSHLSTGKRNMSRWAKKVKSKS